MRTQLVISSKLMKILKPSTALPTKNSLNTHKPRREIATKFTKNMIKTEEFEFEHAPNGLVGSITLQPNQSLSWRAFKYFILFMMLLSFGIATAFSVMGYWVILPFTVLEMSVLSYCLWLCLRRTSMQEVISFSGEEIRLEAGVKTPTEIVTWQRFFTKIHVERAIHPWYRKTVSLVHRGESREIGNFLTQEEQEKLIETLNHLVRRADLAQRTFPSAEHHDADSKSPEAG
jgi:uncharacterized membrane protein